VSQARFNSGVPPLRRVFRVLYEARPRAGATQRGLPGLALVSVAVTADSAHEAHELARHQLLPFGWEPVGGPLRTSDLTGLLDSTDDLDDSGFGEYAARWLREVHDETLRQGVSVRMLSGDYGFLDRPQSLPRV
jgi:hypothetical protein